MSLIDSNINVFIELLRAGLFPVHGEGGMIHDSLFKDVDWESVYQLAQEQSVPGIVLQGIERFRIQDSGFKLPKVLLLQWIGEVQAIEQRNKSMNVFVAELIDGLRKKGNYCLLVKGQGVAQSYERPLWRSSGDVDLFLSADDYKKAQTYLQTIGVKISHETEKNKERLNAEFQVGEWLVELHGTLHANLSSKMDKVIDSVQYEVFTDEKVCVWKNGEVDVTIPAPNEDIVFVFSHILQHFFFGGIGLRQLCDLCRLLWTYRDSIDQNLLCKRLQKMGVVTEWKVFVALMVEHLGLPAEAAPLYESGYEMKAGRALNYILEVGNFGHNRDSSYLKEKSSVKRKFNILVHQMRDSMRMAKIFPIDAWLFFFSSVTDGVKNAFCNR